MTINIAMFKNDKKEKDTHPDYTGWNKDTGDSVSGWIKEARNGSKYISLSFETKAEKEQRLAEIKNDLGGRAGTVEALGVPGAHHAGTAAPVASSSPQAYQHTDIHGDDFNDDIPF